ncbi:MAG: hypothetical protein ABI794_10445 [Betaproteobacteria bacterium]
MTPLPRLFLCIVLALSSGASPAQPQDDTADSGISKLPPPRSERLDVFGAGMCHQCEWRPRAKLMAAPEQCGTDASGTAKLAVFECGRNPACDTVCNFVSCDTP